MSTCLANEQAPSLVRGVIFVGDTPEGAVQRLQRGGLKAGQCHDEEHLASLQQEWGLTPSQILAVGRAPAGLRQWEELTQQAVGLKPSIDQIMQAIVQSNRQQLLSTAPASTAEAPAPNSSLLVVGYVMKASREEQLSSCGLLHLLPDDGMCFMPFDVTRLHEQQGHVDILLHKGSDELVPTADGGVVWSDRLLQLQEWLKGHQHICVVDAFQNTRKVLDRLQLSMIIDQLQHLQLPSGAHARAPKYLHIENFTAGDLLARLKAAGMQPPYIVKPLVACGVKHSHSMALVLQEDALQQLQGQVPLPAVVQEFVNHGGLQYKVYVLGQQVFVTPRASIPNVLPDTNTPPHEQLLLFDSLGSLPTELPTHMTRQRQQNASATTAAEAPTQPDMGALKAVAAFLQSQLGLTLFGFDVVVAQNSCLSVSSSETTAEHTAQQRQQQQQQELVVIDVNYFPNYRGGDDTPALFRTALRQCWDTHRGMDSCQPSF